MRNLALLLTAALLCLHAVPASPGPLETCWKNANTHPEASACLYDMLAQADAEMQRTTEALRLTILLNPFFAAHDEMRDEMLNDLNASSREFPTERERWCTMMGDMLAPGNGTGDVATDCMIRAARSRTRDMRQHISW